MNKLTVSNLFTPADKIEYIEGKGLSNSQAVKSFKYANRNHELKRLKEISIEAIRIEFRKESILFQ